MEHCMIDGERCSKCCEVLTIRESKSFRDWRSYVRRYGYPEDFEGDRIYDMLKPISKRRAKKLNPFLVSRVGSDGSYWTCKHFTGSGCGNYENRPVMCSGYPLYSHSEETWFESEEFNRGDLYTEGCTYYITLEK